MRTLIVIDMQEDFVRGALANPAAEAIIPNIQAKIEEYKSRNDTIIFTKDTHHSDYLSTQEGKLLPVPHCIVNTEGWNIIPELDAFNYLHSFIIEKTSFGYSSWLSKMNLLGVTSSSGFAGCLGSGLEFELVGTCTDICVVSNALILKSTYPEAKITVDASCCAGLTPEKHKAALETMKSCQIYITNEE